MGIDTVSKQEEGVSRVHPSRGSFCHRQCDIEATQVKRRVQIYPPLTVNASIVGIFFLILPAIIPLRRRQQIAEFPDINHPVTIRIYNGNHLIHQKIRGIFAKGFGQ